jgi:hypothetical protein
MLSEEQSFDSMFGSEQNGGAGSLPGVESNLIALGSLGQIEAAGVGCDVEGGGAEVVG